MGGKRERDRQTDRQRQRQRYRQRERESIVIQLLYLVGRLIIIIANERRIATY